MSEYEFDAERWLRNVAEVQSHRAGAGPAMLRENMLKCAEEIHRLRAENDTLRNEARVYRAQCDMRDEWRDKIEAELAALRLASSTLLSDVDEYFRCADIGESRDKLAALVGEG